MTEIQFDLKHQDDASYTNPETWTKGKVVWVKTKLEEPWFECRFHHIKDGRVFVYLPRENGTRNIDFNYVTAENMLGRESLVFFN